MPAIRSACVLLSLTSITFGQLPRTHQVAAPPDDISSGVVAWPDPAAAATRSRSSLTEVDFELRDGSWSFEAPVHVAADEPFTLLPVGTHHDEWHIALRQPGGNWVSVNSLVTEGRATIVGGEMPGDGGAIWIEATQIRPLESAVAGEWRMRISAPKTRGERPPAGRIFVAGSGSLRLVSHLTTYRLVSDRAVGIAAYLVDSDMPSEQPLVGVAEEARLTVESAWGRQDVVMLDDGRHDDGAAGDGRFGAFLPRGLSGDVRAIATLRGRAADGQVVALSGQHAFPMLEPALSLTGQVSTRVVDDHSLVLDVDMQSFRDLDRLQISGEVWGRDSSGSSVPVAWLSRIVSPTYTPLDGHGSLSLSLDGRWLSRAGTTDGLELRELRVQDPDTHVIFDLLDSVPLEALALPSSAFAAPPRISRDMLMGPSSRATAPSADPRTLPLGGSLMLVHGYCSGGSVWPDADFDEPKLEFLDPNQNRSHDQFAQLMLATGSSVPSFGVVAHSQGGAAALHLYTYYSSGLDGAQGPRRIQSVATPYQGTPLADLGGFACGVNFDLSVSGAAMWLAGIPSWARDDVYYWTTVDAGSACNFLANLFLDFTDNDGTTERVRGQLPGAHNQGHIPGWCHTTGMTFPANYTDSALNAVRNTMASR